MVVTFAEMIGYAFRLYKDPGVPESGKNNPRKNDIIPIGPALDDRFAALQVNLKPVQSMRYATTGPITLSGEQVVDGFMTANDPVVAWKQANPKENGPYITASGAWIRMSAFNTADELFAARFFIREGTANANITLGVQNPTPPVPATDDILIDVVANSDITGLLVDVPSGPPDALKLARLGGDGRYAYGFMPVQFQMDEDDDAPRVSIGAGLNYWIGLYADGSVHIPALDPALLKTDMIMTSTLEDDAWFGQGDNLNVKWGIWADTIRHPEFDAVANKVDEFEVFSKGIAPVLEIDGDSWSDLTSTALPVRINAQGWAYWMQWASDSRLDFEPANDHGMGGDHVTNVVNGLAWLDTTPPRHVMMPLPGINDRRTGEALAQSIDGLETIQERVLAAGHRLHWLVSPMMGDANPYIAPGEDYHPGLSSQQAAYFMFGYQWALNQSGHPRIEVHDWVSRMIDPLSANAKALGDILREGLHLGARGASKVGRISAEHVIRHVPPRPRLAIGKAQRRNADNPSGLLIENAMMEGTAGTLNEGCTGTLPDGYTAHKGAAALTADFSIEVGDDGYNRIKCEFGGTSTGTASESVFDWQACSAWVSVPIDPAELTAGDLIDVYVRQGFEDGAQNIRGMPVILRYSITGVDQTLTMAISGTPNTTRSNINLDFPTTGLSGIVKVPRLPIVAGTINSATLEFYITGPNSTGGALAVDGTCWWSRPTPFKWSA